MSLITTFSKQMPFNLPARSYFEAMVLSIITYPSLPVSKPPPISGLLQSRKAPRFCRDGMVKREPTNSTTLQSRPAPQCALLICTFDFATALHQSRRARPCIINSTKIRKPLPRTTLSLLHPRLPRPADTLSTRGRRDLSVEASPRDDASRSADAPSRQFC